MSFPFYRLFVGSIGFLASHLIEIVIRLQTLGFRLCLADSFPSRDLLDKIDEETRFRRKIVAKNRLSERLEVSNPDHVFCVSNSIIR